MYTVWSPYTRSTLKLQTCSFLDLRTLILPVPFSLLHHQRGKDSHPFPRLRRIMMRGVGGVWRYWRVEAL